MQRETRIVIGADGTVLDAAGDVPPGILGQRLEHCDDLPREVRGAGKALLRQLRGSSKCIVTDDVALNEGRGSAQLIAIEALFVRRTSTDVRTLLSSKLAIVSSQADAEGVALDVRVDADVPARVHVDAEKLAWAVTTLVGNALRYVRAASRRMGSGAVSVRAAFDARRSELAIEVQDDGPGIPEDTVTRLFRRDGLDVRGAGLALLVMADACAAQGGRIDVRSSIGSDHGTTVRMTIPAPVVE